jgi:hypothetical protein
MFVEHLHSASREDQRGRAAESPKGGAGTLRELIEGGCFCGGHSGAAE